MYYEKAWQSLKELVNCDDLLSIDKGSLFAVRFIAGDTHISNEDPDSKIVKSSHRRIQAQI